MTVEEVVSVQVGDANLEGAVMIPDGAQGIVVFAHGSGSSRHSPRNRRVAARLGEEGLATLLLDLLTVEEEEVDRLSGELRFDIGLLARRLTGSTAWLRTRADTADLPIGLFGASTGAAAALVAAAEQPAAIGAVVSRGGRPDLAGDRLGDVRAPCLLLVGGADQRVLELNERARTQMNCEVHIEVVPDASHLFEEPGALAAVGDHAARWFARHLRAA